MLPHNEDNMQEKDTLDCLQLVPCSSCRTNTNAKAAISVLHKWLIEYTSNQIVLQKHIALIN